MQTVIMAGGRGSRIRDMFPDLPKPLIPIYGIPVLERELISLRDQGFTDIIMTVGFMAEMIKNYFGDGIWLGIHITYFVEEKPLGNAGALLKLRREGIIDGDFLLLNADSVFDIDMDRFMNYHNKKGGLATLFTHPNSHPYDSGLVISCENGCVRQLLSKEDKRPQWYKNRVNAGIHIINSVALDRSGIDPDMIGKVKEGESIKVDLDRDILKPLCGKKKVYCYDSTEYVKDMGTPGRYKEVCDDYKKGIIQAKNLKNRQKAVFLDRDGTINRYVDFLTDINDFELLPGVAEAIRAINNSGYLAIVVTNQPVVARGDVSFEELNEIHMKMETLLGEQGAYLDSIYFCPHHPDRGYDGEITELKIECECRKPKPGMLIRASKDFNIDLTESWMVGDSDDDILAGKAAGCRTAFIGKTNKNSQNITVTSLLDFVEKIIL